ncbi:MAG TPA: DUF2911 domain-containing protein [Chitinophagaceae bacterium]|nr:DUF2911 domain-containing protein [Chitinophagaceae bacterium]
MKKIITALLLASGLMASIRLSAQSEEDKSKRVSLPDTATQKISTGANIVIAYSRPSVKGRTIGKDLEPMDGKVWRTGANEATTFETNKDVTIDGQRLPAGKYALFTLFNGREVTIIFNKTWNQWGAFKYKEADDQLRVKTKYTDGPHSEKMTFTIAKSGEVLLAWGTRRVKFKVR